MKMAGRKTKPQPHVEYNWWSWLIWENLHHFWTVYTWNALNVNANIFELRISAGATEKIPGCENSHAKGVAGSRVMRINALKDIANWRTERLNNSTKSLLHAWMTISSKRKNWKWLENCPMCVLKSYWHAFFLARIGRLDIPWSVNKRWLSIVDWVYSKTQSFAGDLEDSKSTSGEFSVSPEVEHSFPDVGCVRNKLQSLPVQLNLKFFLWMLVCAGMVCSFSSSTGFGSRIWLLKYCILPKTYQYGETRGETKPKGNTPTPERSNTSTDMMLNYSMWITLPQPLNLLTLAPCFTFVRMMKQWSRWQLEADVRRWDTCPEPTELRLIGCLTESI